MLSGKNYLPGNVHDISPNGKLFLNTACLCLVDLNSLYLCTEIYTWVKIVLIPGKFCIGLHMYDFMLRVTRSSSKPEKPQKITV